MTDLAFTYTCTYCGKGYKRKGCYDKHIATCEITHESSRYRKQKMDEIQELDDVPTMEKMYEMFQIMTIRCKDLETEVEELKKWVGNKKKKINIISWLNDTNEENKAYTDFNTWCLNTTITDKELNCVFQTNLVTAIVNILLKNCVKPNTRNDDGSGEGNGDVNDEDIEDIMISNENPIRTFTHKKVFYIYIENDVSDDSSCHWREMRHSEFTRLCEFYYNEIFRFQNEYLNNIIAKDPTAISSDTVIKNSKKMLDPMNPPNKKRTISAIKNKFYDRIKCSLPSYVCSIEDI